MIQRARSYLGVVSLVLFLGLAAALQATPDTCPPIRYRGLTNVVGILWILSWAFLVISSFVSEEA